MNRHYIESLCFPLKQSLSKVVLPLWQLNVSSLSSPDNKPASQGRMNDFPSQFLNLIQRKQLSNTNPFSFCSSETKLITCTYYNVINFWHFIFTTLSMVYTRWLVNMCLHITWKILKPWESRQVGKIIFNLSSSRIYHNILHKY